MFDLVLFIFTFNPVFNFKIFVKSVENLKVTQIYLLSMKTLKFIEHFVDITLKSFGVLSITLMETIPLIKIPHLLDVSSKIK